MLFIKLSALYPFMFSLLVLVSARPKAKDVFLSFRGRETRAGFTGHLHAALEKAGIPTFIDESGIQRGANIYSEIERAINESKISIILFSKLYATSTYCLEELVIIMERRRTADLHVVPIFYKVSPSQVQEQSGGYGQAFAELEKQFREEIHKVEGWRAALREVTDLAGMVYKNGWSEVAFIEEIVEVIRLQLIYITLGAAGNGSIAAPCYWIWDTIFLAIKGGLLLFMSLVCVLLVMRLVLSVYMYTCIYIDRSLFRTADYVFVSIGGKDTEEFTSALYKALVQSGIKAYRDHAGIRRKESRWLEIRKAINISKLSVVVFSKDFASSERSLDELLVIMDRKRTDDGYIVVPIYYDVYPSQVKMQTGAYEKVFAKYERSVKAGIVKEWRTALKDAVAADADHRRGVPLALRRNRHDRLCCVQDLAEKIGKTLNSRVERNDYWAWFSPVL